MEEEKKKNGIEFLKAQGYKKISTKTFISDIELEHFLNKDFANINKTRALGFIQILEREYDVDLAELKKAYLEYENSHKEPEPETIFIETPIENEKIWQKYIPHAAAFLIIAGLAFYMFNISDDTKATTPDQLAVHIEENKSTIKKAEKNLKELEENNSALLKKESISASSVVRDNDLDLDKVVLQMMKERNISTDDDNVSIDLSSSEKNIKPAEVNQSKTVKATPVAVKPEIKKTQKVKPVKKEITPGEFYIIPTQKAWVGIIYLDNFTKKDFLIRSKLPLDSSRDQLIVIGHRHFMIYNKTYSVKFRGKGPVRFIYRDGELMEISKKEFIRSSAGVAW